MNFKNYEGLEIEFSSNMNALTGFNGVGKTNILDAIYYLSMCKSYLNSIDKQNIRFGAQFFTIQGLWEIENKRSTVLCSVKNGSKKVFKRNKVDYEKLSDHIGLYPVVFVSPYDGDLIAEGSENRRKWMDGILSQLDRVYLERLIQYQRILEQRNALLKQINQRNLSSSELDIWDEQLVQLGLEIYKSRTQFVEDFIPVFQKYYEKIGVSFEVVGMPYKSHFSEGDVMSQLQINRARDLALQYTTVGTHKDDLVFELNGHPVKKFGSQGQQKSFIIALRLAQYEYTKTLCNKNPILLLDDIFDKLDGSRVEKLIELVSTDFFGQVIITDTDQKRLEILLSKHCKDYRIFDVASIGSTEAHEN